MIGLAVNGADREQAHSYRCARFLVGVTLLAMASSHAMKVGGFQAAQV